jgi:hypothetical protein
MFTVDSTVKSVTGLYRRPFVKKVISAFIIQMLVLSRGTCCDWYDHCCLQHNIADITKLQPVSYGETYHTFSDSQNLQTDIKEEKDPLSVTSPVIKTESEVSCLYVSLYLSVFRYKMHECLPYKMHECLP